MKKFIIFFILLITNYKFAVGRSIGETQITTEDGIEVFQEEKYYLLKKNVEIQSDEFNLLGQLVKIYFDKDLYDIIELNAEEDVNFISEKYNIKGKGDTLTFNFKDQKINVIGLNSELFLETTKMYSNGSIKVDNINGSFLLEGSNSKLVSDNILIIGSKIIGVFDVINGKRSIKNLEVEDNKIVNIKTDDINMFSKKAIYDKNKSVIELFEDVQINRGVEVITGDYGILDTNKNSYKVKSKNSKKVKAIISNKNE